MTKQEEIREGIARELFILTHPFEELIEEAYYPKWKDDVDIILRLLHSQGVVIKVDELPCPRCKGSGEVRKWQEQYVGEGYWTRIGCPKCKGTGRSGYVTTEPLKEE